MQQKLSTAQWVSKTYIKGFAGMKVWRNSTGCTSIQTSKVVSRLVDRLYAVCDDTTLDPRFTKISQQVNQPWCTQFEDGMDWREWGREHKERRERVFHKVLNQFVFALALICDVWGFRAITYYHLRTANTRLTDAHNIWLVQHWFNYYFQHWASYWLLLGLHLLLC